MYVTEDTVRTDPNPSSGCNSDPPFRNGARAIVLCDNRRPRHANGAFNLVKFAIDEVVKPSGEKNPRRLAWYNDRGLSIANSSRRRCRCTPGPCGR